MRLRLTGKEGKEQGCRMSHSLAAQMNHSLAARKSDVLTARMNQSTRPTSHHKQQLALRTPLTYSMGL
eukprot:790840-Pelagomonas_calceolata.AAC.4